MEEGSCTLGIQKDERLPVELNNRTKQPRSFAPPKEFGLEQNVLLEEKFDVSRAGRGERLVLLQTAAKTLNCHEYSFYVRIIREWNGFPANVVDRGGQAQSAQNRSLIVLAYLTIFADAYCLYIIF